MAILRSSGFVQLRRGLFEHVMNGQMSSTECFLYTVILANADPCSGIWKGSAGVLAALFSVPNRTCRKALERLEEAGYIKRFPIPGSTHSYPILVHLFECSDGAAKGMRLNAMGTETYTEPQYFPCRDDAAADAVVDAVAVAGKYIDTREKKQEKKEVAEESQSAGEKAVGTLPCKGSKSWPFHASQVSDWAAAYPAVDVIAELRVMKQWLIANARKNPTFGGMHRFVNGWLARSQRKHGKGNSSGKVVGDSSKLRSERSTDTYKQVLIESGDYPPGFFDSPDAGVPPQPRAEREHAQRIPPGISRDGGDPWDAAGGRSAGPNSPGIEILSPSGGNKSSHKANPGRARSRTKAIPCGAGRAETRRGRAGASEGHRCGRICGHRRNRGGLLPQTWAEADRGTPATRRPSICHRSRHGPIFPRLGAGRAV